MDASRMVADHWKAKLAACANAVNPTSAGLSGDQVVALVRDVVAERDALRARVAELEARLERED